MDLEEIDINRRNWVDFAHDRDHWRALVNVALNLRVFPDTLYMEEFIYIAISPVVLPLDCMMSSLLGAPIPSYTNTVNSQTCVSRHPVHGGIYADQQVCGATARNYTS